MTSTKQKNPYADMAERLAAKGYATESVRVRALASYKAKPGEIPPLGRALIPDANPEEAVAMDVATQLSAMLEGLTTVNGTLSIATATFAAAMVLRRFERMAGDAKVDDGAEMGADFGKQIIERATEIQDRLLALSDIILGRIDNVVVTDGSGRVQ